MLIGEGRIRAYINCYTANSGYTNVARRFRAAIEKGELTYEDYSQDVLMLQLHAASLGLPYLPVRMMQGSGLVKYWGISEEQRKTMEGVDNLKCAEIENPFEPGEKLLAVPVPKLDCAIIHVQQASPDGTCIIEGDEFHDIDIAIAAKRTIVTCEEIVSDEYIRRDPTKTRIFGECVNAVVRAPYGAWPSQCYNYYDDDDKALKEYNKASMYLDEEDAKAQLQKAADKAAKAAAAKPEDEKLLPLRLLPRLQRTLPTAQRSRRPLRITCRSMYTAVRIRTTFLMLSAVPVSWTLRMSRTLAILPDTN